VLPRDHEHIVPKLAVEIASKVSYCLMLLRTVRGWIELARHAMEHRDGGF
jgi:hypothetical protein